MSNLFSAGDIVILNDDIKYSFKKKIKTVKKGTVLLCISAPLSRNNEWLIKDRIYVLNEGLFVSYELAGTRKSLTPGILLRYRQKQPHSTSDSNVNLCEDDVLMFLNRQDSNTVVSVYECILREKKIYFIMSLRSFLLSFEIIEGEANT